ncbi:MAG: T9SS type A sorting domain-containing protein [Mesonia hippocampi]|uniref:T9SS type A sorting domain-containing protein n=1 Tax=Mesonia hippocampi TaxID=1628250 RepID=UPI003F9E9D78
MNRKILLSSLLTILFTSFMSSQVFFEDFGSNTTGNFTENQISGNLNWTTTALPTADNNIAIYFGSTTAELDAESALETPSLDLSQASSYALTFTALMNANGTNVNELHVEISPDNGTNWYNLQSYTSEITVGGGSELTEKKIIINQHLSTTAKVRFRAINKQGYVVVLGKTLLLEAYTNDAELVEITTTKFHVANDAVNIKSNIKNTGTDPITSLELNWEIDGANTQTQNITGLNIQPGDTQEVTHTNTWTATAGEHTLNVLISKVNNSSALGGYYTVELDKNLNVATNSTTNTPILERFTSSTCGPCATFNNAVYNDFHAQRSNEYVYIAYHVNWPGSGDPYQTAAANNRASQFYGATGVPALFVGGKLSNWDNAATWGDVITIVGNDLDRELAKNAFFEFTSADATITPNNDVVINLDITPYLTGNYTIRAAVYEKETTGNVGSNQETEFTNVMMKLMPEATNFSADTPIQKTISASMANTFVEEWDDLEVIAFIQDDSSKEIMQTIQITNVTLSNDKLVKENALNIYPNPASEMVTITTSEAGSLEIFDITGKLVKNNIDLSNGDNAININTLSKGVYILKITSENKNSYSEKLIIK